MNCIVTAGPTFEKLDEVRRLTNFSTGALGSELTDYLVGKGHRVTLLRGFYSTFTAASKAQRFEIFTTGADLADRLKKFGSTKIDAVFHAAAVGDFTFGKFWEQGAKGKLNELKSRKIPTRAHGILAELKPTPKIISNLREWFPKARIIGWKYELDGDREETIARGMSQIKENKTDACVLNGAAYGIGFGVLEASGKLRRGRDDKALFALLLKQIDGGD